MMLRTRWHKVLIDLWKNRGRTLIVALAIAVGVYSIGTVLNVREVLIREYDRDQDGALMASAILRTAPFDEDLAERVAELPGVAAAEGRREIRTLVYEGGLPPSGRPPVGEQSIRQQDLVLTVISDFEEMQVDALTPLEGPLPPPKRGLILERQSLDYLGVEVGDVLVVELEDGLEKELTVVGIAHDPLELGPGISGRASGYVTLETLGALGLGEFYTALHIRLSENRQDRDHILAVVDGVEEHLERTGRQVYSQRLITESIADPVIGTLVLILSSFGVIILLLSGFLVINAISALISQQVPQIGVMKLIGARRGQIMILYIVTVLVYGLIAVAVGIPLALLTGRVIMVTLAEPMLNVMTDDYSVPLTITLVQVTAGLLLPLLAGLAPVLQGTRITTHRALNDAGMTGGGAGQGWSERVLQAVQRLAALKRPILLALRNTLRHKGRLVQTLIVLTIGTALFISVLSVRDSVNATVENFMRLHGYDVSLELGRPYRIARLEQVMQQAPGVVEVEGWSEGGATRQRPDGTESDPMRLTAVPAGSTFVTPGMLEGNWLASGDHGQVRNGIVINSDVLDKEPDLHTGAEVVLDIGGREATYHVVGVVPTESRGEMIYMDLEDYAYITRTPSQVTQLQVAIEAHDGAAQDEAARLLREHLESRGIEVSSTETTQIMRDENKLMFTIIVAFLLLMAGLLAAVGGLGLTTTMGINVLERVREIGVLRAIGASNASVRQIVLVEGIIMGLISWGVGLLLSVPVSIFMSEQLGLALIKIPLAYQYSILAAVLWFVVLQIIATVASLGPARNAERLTIREVLAYE
ncbi:MAG: ABC transporter permease [Anaerolineae bacterium]|jgi:putative ABC transport system permease protein